MASDQPTAEHSTSEQRQPATGQSASDQSATDRSPSDPKATERRSIDQPATEQPATGQPATEHPVGEQPATGQPADERPSSDQPATDQSLAGGPPDKQDATGRTPSDDQLPASYDQLIPIERLVHGEYNPRRVQPTAQLRRSIAADGMQTPLIVRPDPNAEGYYHITDGWQRYQAATDHGWEQVPVRIYESPLEALAATESASIVREWSTYDWAQYCRAIAVELADPTAADRARHEVAARVADRTTRTTATVQRYLAALSLPTLLHPLLYEGPDGTEQEWTALRNYNPDVRRYRGLPWTVAARLGHRQHRDGVTEDRVIAIGAAAVEYETADVASDFVRAATDDPTLPLETIDRRVTATEDGKGQLQVPPVTVTLGAEHKEALMAYCADNRQPLSRVVEAQLQEFATELRTG